MPYTEEDGGRLNNFAIEPKMYQAQPASEQQKKQTLVFGIGGLVLVVGLIAIAAAIS